MGRFTFTRLERDRRVCGEPWMRGRGGGWGEECGAGVKCTSPWRGWQRTTDRWRGRCERDAPWKKHMLKGGVNKDGRKTWKDFCRRLLSGSWIYQTGRNCPSMITPKDHSMITFFEEYTMIYGIPWRAIFFFFFFNPIQPFFLPRISTQREKSGLISRTFVQFNLNSNIELFFFFFFYPLFSPEPNNRFVYEKKKKRRFSFFAATHFPRGNKVTLPYS